MTQDRILEIFDPVDILPSQAGEVLPRTSVDEFVLVYGEERLRNGTVVTGTGSARQRRILLSVNPIGPWEAADATPAQLRPRVPRPDQPCRQITAGDRLLQTSTTPSIVKIRFTTLSPNVTF